VTGKSTSEGIGLFGHLVIGGFAIFLVYSFYKILVRDLVSIKQQLITLFYSTINNYLVHLALLFLLGILASYLSYKGYLKIQKIKERNMEIEEEVYYIDDFLRTDFRRFDYEELNEKLDELDNKRLIKNYPDLKPKIKEAENILVELKHEDELKNIIYKKSAVQKEVRKLQLEKEELERSEKQNRYVLIGELDLDRNRVFDKSNLNEDQIKVLLEEGYKQVNEYCVAKKKIITVLIRPILNHSVAHTFLVWSTRQLLEEYPEIEKIIEHETRDADLTFRVGKKIFAIEIETGTLLRKKKQLEEKIKYLNLKYKKKWLVVVSNRNLERKYNKFGLCTQRKRVCEKLEKMIGI